MESQQIYFDLSKQKLTEQKEHEEIETAILNPELEEKPGKPKIRDQWSNQFEFLLSCVSMSVGLGNIWRFPKVAQENGGGAFLVPYFVVMVLVGRPIYYLELSLGQFSSLSQVKIWRCNPLFKGVGYSAMMSTLLVMTYYCSIMATTMFYFFSSFAQILPWTECDSSWSEYVNCTDLTVHGNETKITTSIAAQYFEHGVLKEQQSMENGIGLPNWRLSLCLLASWLIICFSLIKGVKSSGKVAYFTALFPYVVLLTLLVRGVTLDGAWNGIRIFLTPDWKIIYSPKVWYKAVSQCFFSLNAGFGSVVMFGSYNPFRHNIARDAAILCVMDTVTSFIAGITVFAVLGYLSEQTGLAVEEVLGNAGTEIAFVSYPTAIAKFPVPQLFAILFFLMLYTLGIGSSIADAGAVISVFADKYPDVKRWKITTVICATAFLIGLVYVTPGGQFVLELVDYFGAAFVIILIAVLEVIGIMWVYGMNNFVHDIEFMLGTKVSWYSKICWGYIIPVGLGAMFVYSICEAEPLKYKVPYPLSALVCGWALAISCLLPLPLCAFLAIRKSKAASFLEKLKEATSPVEDFGPMNLKTRADWIDYKRCDRLCQPYEMRSMY